MHAVRTSGELRVAVLAGGDSAEREVSLASGRQVMASLARRGHDVEWFDPKTVDTLWAEHRGGRADHGLALFELTCLGLWRAAAPLTL